MFESNLIKYVYICLLNSKFKLDNAEFQSGLDTNKANIKKKNILFKVDKKYGQLGLVLGFLLVLNFKQVDK